jgi:2'-5' RNA ligase
MKFISLNKWLNEETIKGLKPIDNQKRDFYGCIMMGAKIDNWKEFHTAGIDKEDVYIKPHDKSYGLETDPHVTVLFGIHEDEIDEDTMKNVIEQNMRPITLRVDEVDVFEGDEYDVVKYNLPLTEELQKQRDLFTQFPNTQTFPDYKPHMTIAYVNPGAGKKYKRKLSEPFDVTFTKGIYSYHDDPEDPEAFSTKEVDLEREYKDPDKIYKGVAVRETVNFERGQESKKSMGIGRHRPIGGQQLVDVVFDNVWSEVKDDPKFKDEDLIEFKDHVYEWVLAMAEDPDTGQIPVQDPNHSIFSADRFHEYWDEINMGSDEHTYRGL